ncbi:hypothetical protein C0Q70_11716 [Pomacea canaliculata]|uniref:Uncharacterized protein n=1 Tax=Pomacea canaliculata TaxID=400727 RepID=A0A2T7P6T7_POMCA|nr:hypothetical protein C0Q70_11716 [Pomacea canaliculata]
MATSGGAGKEHIRLRAQLAPTKATENSQDHTVSERESQKRDPGDEGIIEEQLQNILPEIDHGKVELILKKNTSAEVLLPMHKLSLWFQGQPLGLSHDAGSAESPCEVSRDRSGVELPAESSAGRTFFELCHTCQGCGTKNKTAFPFGSADLRNVSTFSSCVHKSPQSIPDWSCRIHQPSQETVSCAKPAVCTSSNEPVAALPVEQEGYLEAADARMMNLEEDEVSGGEDDDESSGEELQRGGAEVDIDRDDEDNGEDVMIVDLRAERLQRIRQDERTM